MAVSLRVVILSRVASLRLDSPLWILVVIGVMPSEEVQRSGSTRPRGCWSPGRTVWFSTASSGRRRSIPLERMFWAVLKGYDCSSSACPGGLQPVLSALGPQAHQAERKTVALFGVTTVLEDAGDELGGARSELLRPSHHPRGGPLGVLPVRRAHVLGLGRVLAFPGEPAMGSHSEVLAEDLDGGAGDAGLDPLLQEGEGHAVVVLLDLDVVVDVDSAGLSRSRSRSDG